MFLGPVCEYVIAAVARYAAVWKVPVITPGAQANAFLAKQRYSTLTRIMGSYHQLGTVFQPIMQLFGWKVAGLLYEDYGKQQNKGHHPCNFMLQAVYQGMSVKPFHKSFSNSDSHVDFASLLRELMKAARSELFLFDFEVKSRYQSSVALLQNCINYITITSQ